MADANTGAPISNARGRRRPWRTWLFFRSVLTSLIFHLSVLIGLALWVVGVPSLGPRQLAMVAQFGNDELAAMPIDEPRVETPRVDAIGASNEELLSGVELVSAVEAPQLESAVGDALPQTFSPDANLLPRDMVGFGDEMRKMSQLWSGRDPEGRGMRAQREGGSAESESSVERGLLWLARHQNYDGSWSLDAFADTPECHGQCGDAGGHSDTAATAMALLPFLGAGETHLKGEHKLTVGLGLRWLVAAVDRRGSAIGPGVGRMYAQGQVALVLCEAYGMTQDPALRLVAQRTIDFIVKAQHPAGGWRYTPKMAGDISVTGWQLMALTSAKLAYLRVPDSVFRKAGKFLDSCQLDHYGGLYCYLPGRPMSPVMTAEALLCRMYGGWQAKHPGVTAGVELLLTNFLPGSTPENIYYWYYASQLMHHVGGESWQRWNSAMRDRLIGTQESVGHESGSWKPHDRHSIIGGRLYCTALALCVLEVYYRHMPLYQLDGGRLALTSGDGEADDEPADKQ